MISNSAVSLRKRPEVWEAETVSWRKILSHRLQIYGALNRHGDFPRKRR